MREKRRKRKAQVLTYESNNCCKVLEARKPRSRGKALERRRRHEGTDAS
jgi:hypothetical protein